MSRSSAGVAATDGESRRVPSPETLPSTASSSTADSPSRGDPDQLPTIPVEDRRAKGGWGRRCVATLGAVLLRPWTSFAHCPEPVDHGAVLRFLATLRLPPWVVLVTVLAIGFLTSDGPEPVPTRSVHAFLDPALGRALSTWLVILVPVGMPLLYFAAGLFAHIGIALTGGAPRSVGTTMRAVGYALAPVVLAVGVLDIPLYLHMLPGQVYLGVVVVLGLLLLVLCGVGLARTHRISVTRGFLVALLPLIVWSAATVGRAVLELDRVPGMPTPSSPYWVP